TVVGRLHRALGHDLAGRLDGHAGAEIEPGGVGRLAGRTLPGHAGVLVGEGGEVRAVLLEAGRADVGEVVGDDAHPRVLRLKPRSGDLESRNWHGTVPFFSRGASVARRSRRRRARWR